MSHLHHFQALLKGYGATGGLLRAQTVAALPADPLPPPRPRFWSRRARQAFWDGWLVWHMLLNR